MGVHRLEPAEWERLRAIRLEALSDAPGAFGSSVEREQAYDEVRWRELLAWGPWWVAEEDGSDVGLVAGEAPADRSPVVYSMWVHAEFRGTGAAAAMLDAVVAWAVADGADSLWLTVTDRAPRARAFYERFGFVTWGTPEPLDRDPAISTSKMVLDLTRRRA